MARLVAAITRSFWRTALAVTLLAMLAVVIGTLFRLTWGGSIALYFVVWWTALFVVLPVSVRTQAEVGEIHPGSDPGAPAAPALLARSFWTTVVATLVFILVAAFFPLAGL